ncbi:hypothetical protein AYK25_07165 [Thermoplasmatales archaeon SM1-50]|nr:MAG: hypothetical protein AYK25_07165 [Thermoplasmatales archaeon SM1-50]
MNEVKGNMKNLFIGIGIFIMLCVGSLSGCLDEKSKFIGTWFNQDGSTSMTFESDGTVTITGTGPLGFVSLTGTFNYSVADKKITFSSGDTGVTFNYRFPESNQLILTTDQGASLLLTKK